MLILLSFILLCLLLLCKRNNYHLPCRRVNFYVAYLYAGKLLAPAPIVYIAALATGHFVIVSVSSSHNYIPLAVKRSISAASKAAAITNRFDHRRAPLVIVSLVLKVLPMSGIWFSRP